MIISPPSIIPTSTFNPPTPSLINVQDPMNVLTMLLRRDEPQCLDASHYRTTANIVLSCLTTAFACSWASYHMNVPQSSSKSPSVITFHEKVSATIKVLLFPGMSVGFAMEELMAAKKYKDEWNANFKSQCLPQLVTIPGKSAEQYERELQHKNYDSSWTLVHGFLAQMGGIWLYDNRDGSFKTFVPGSNFSKDPRMLPIIQQIGLISPKDILDKSKGDWVTKLFVVIQTTWFITQCAARCTIRLPVTQLEVVILAYAVQNIFLYILWWEKPQSLTEPYRFYLERGEHSAEERMAEGDDNDGPNAIENLQVIDSHSEEIELSDQGLSFHHSRVLRTLKELSKIDISARCFVEIIFGAIHLIPLWFSVFPSDAEKKFWRISTYYVTAIPVVKLAILLGLNLAPSLSRSFFLLTAVGALFWCYTMTFEGARIILLILSFTTLRSLPTEALLNIQWTRYIPHF